MEYSKVGNTTLKHNYPTLTYAELVSEATSRNVCDSTTISDKEYIHYSKQVPLFSTFTQNPTTLNTSYPTTLHKSIQTLNDNEINDRTEKRSPVFSYESNQIFLFNPNLQNINNSSTNKHTLLEVIDYKPTCGINDLNRIEFIKPLRVINENAMLHDVDNSYANKTSLKRTEILPSDNYLDKINLLAEQNLKSNNSNHFLKSQNHLSEKYIATYNSKVNLFNNQRDINDKKYLVESKDNYLINENDLSKIMTENNSNFDKYFKDKIKNDHDNSSSGCSNNSIFDEYKKPIQKKKSLLDNKKQDKLNKDQTSKETIQTKKPNSCETCNLEFGNRFDLEVHLKRHLYDRAQIKTPLLFPITFKNGSLPPLPKQKQKNVLKITKKSHSKKHISCSKCNQTVSNHLDLIIHEKIHLDYEKNFPSPTKNLYKCTTDECDIEFSTQVALIHHTKVVHTIKLPLSALSQSTKFLCEICKHLFISKKVLDNHLKKYHFNVNDFKF